MSRIRADQLVNRAGSGGPKFPHGVAEGFSVSGVVTATSYRGDGSQLTGIDASSLKDGSNVKVQATATGATVTGDISATNATFSGNLTVQGTTTTIDTAVTEVDSLAVDGNVTAGGILGLKGTPDSWVNDSSAAAIQLSGYGALHNYYNNVSLSFNAYQDSSSTSKYLTTDQAARYTLDSGGEHVWYTAPSGTIDTDITFVERLRVTSAGRVGIGTAVPSEKLEVNGGKIFIDGGGNRKITLDPGSNTTYDSRIDASHTLVFRSYVDAGVGVKTCTFNTNGHLLPGEDNGQDLGASNLRWRNIYTGDLNLSNEGSANDVDGTWGQYTIQEGEDDLFLINRRTGKKYKFNLTEVN